MLSRGGLFLLPTQTDQVNLDLRFNNPTVLEIGKGRNGALLQAALSVRHTDESSHLCLSSSPLLSPTPPPRSPPGKGTVHALGYIKTDLQALRAMRMMGDSSDEEFDEDEDEDDEDDSDMEYVVDAIGGDDEDDEDAGPRITEVTSDDDGDNSSAKRKKGAAGGNKAKRAKAVRWRVARGERVFSCVLVRAAHPPAAPFAVPSPF